VLFLLKTNNIYIITQSTRARAVSYVTSRANKLVIII
jgi:hypothetical protein